ncbi:MAG TPA: hypothetical protein VNN10_10665 [Dehalococcoidia bacterium]|nr:hypothetical protein [Dehalococcoidia bacterium]
MPAPVLTMAATITCPHGAPVLGVPSNPNVLIMGAPVLVVTDVFTVAGCPFNISGAPAPCVTVQWTAPAVNFTVNNIPVLLGTSIGLCIGGSGSVPAIVSPGQTQVMAS